MSASWQTLAKLAQQAGNVRHQLESLGVFDHPLSDARIRVALSDIRSLQGMLDAMVDAERERAQAEAAT